VNYSTVSCTRRGVVWRRSNAHFFVAFSQRIDTLHEQYDMCPQGSDGYLGEIPEVSGKQLIRAISGS
jgi:hypothetical protein